MTSENDRRTDTETSERLDAIEKGYRRWAHSTTVILSGLFVLQFALGLLSIHLLGANDDRVKDINANRKESVLSSCAETNSRHDATIAALDDRLQQAIDSGQVPEEDLDRLRESRRFTVSLIDALAPERDCELRAKCLLEPKDAPAALCAKAGLPVRRS